MQLDREIGKRCSQEAAAAAAVAVKKPALESAFKLTHNCNTEKGGDKFERVLVCENS